MQPAGNSDEGRGNIGKMCGIRSEFGTGGAAGGSPMKITRMPAALSASKDEGQYRQRAFRWLLEREVDVSGKRLADLGAGPCNFARVAERFGARVTAVDARDDRVPRSHQAKRGR